MVNMSNMSRVNACYLYLSGKKIMTILIIAMLKIVEQHKRKYKKKKKIIRLTKRHDT